MDNFLIWVKITLNVQISSKHNWINSIVSFPDFLSKHKELNFKWEIIQQYALPWNIKT